MHGYIKKDNPEQTKIPEEKVAAAFGIPLSVLRKQKGYDEFVNTFTQKGGINALHK